jgi:hypothetical protein
VERAVDRDEIAVAENLADLPWTDEQYEAWLTKALQDLLLD